MLKTILIITCRILLIASLLVYLAGSFFRIAFLTDDVRDYFLATAVSCFFVLLVFRRVRIPQIGTTTLKVLNVFGISTVFLLAAFGTWGFFTPEGRRAYDEMDAMYPFFAFLLAGFFTLLLIFMNVVAYRQRIKNKTVND